MWEMYVVFSGGEKISNLLNSGSVIDTYILHTSLEMNVMWLQRIRTVLQMNVMWLHTVTCPPLKNYRCCCLGANMDTMTQVNYRAMTLSVGKERLNVTPGPWRASSVCWLLSHSVATALEQLGPSVNRHRVRPSCWWVSGRLNYI